MDMVRSAHGVVTYLWATTSKVDQFSTKYGVFALFLSKKDNIINFGIYHTEMKKPPGQPSQMGIGIGVETLAE